VNVCDCVFVPLGLSLESSHMHSFSEEKNDKHTVLPLFSYCISQ